MLRTYRIDGVKAECGKLMCCALTLNVVSLIRREQDWLATLAQ